MRKNSIIIIVATLMMLSSLAVGLEASATNNSNWFQASPHVLSGNTEVGNVYIYANGTVSNSSAVHQVGSTNTYNLLVNVNGTLTVERNNTVLDGNGLTINGKQKTAVVSSNVTGLTFENLNMVNSSYGIQLLNVQNTVINNVTVNNTASFSMTMVQTYYSGNITVENSNFLLGNVFTSTYGIDAKYGSSINVSYNSFSGATNEYFVYSQNIGQFVAWGNSIESTIAHGGTAFYSDYGGNALFVNNYVNATDTGIYVDASIAAMTSNNYVNNTYDPFYMEYTGSYISLNDVGLNSQQPLYLDYAGNVLVQNANYTNATSYINVEGTGATLTGITYTSTESEYGVRVGYGSYFNLYNSYVKDNSTSYSYIYGVYSEYTPGWVNLVNDNINVTGYGLYLEYSPLFNVTGSLINATSYGIYSDNNANFGSTISGNTFLVASGGEAMYLYAYDVYNTYVGNNRILSKNTSWGSDGIYIYADYMSSNITIVNNYVLNNGYPVEVYSDEYSSNVIVQNNTIVNSSEAIYIEDYSNVVVSGNTVINTTDGIYVYSDGVNFNVSNNFIENLPGFGGMNYGVEIEDTYGGNNTVSHNTVINVSSSGDGIYLDYCANVIVFSNKVVNGGEYGFYFEENFPIVAFGNSVSNADTGIYSYENYNFTYYSNTITNSNYSFYSKYDYSGVAFANTFMDSQSNNSALYFLSIYANEGPLTFYHNNFVNSTFNSTTMNYFHLAYGYPVFMNKLLPVGGNYYSNYTGSGTNGIGSTPVNFTGSIQDLYPLLNRWTSPTVTFLENGLPAGTSWAVKLSGSLQSGTGSSMVFQQTNGQYTTEFYSVMSVPGYTASVTSGSLNLSGTSNVVTISFTPITYGVTFHESGLANNTSWSVTLNGNTKTTTGTSLSFNVANGTYKYTIGSVSGYTAAMASGSVSVKGGAKSEAVQYNAMEYNLTITQAGLPSGDTWTVTVGNSTYNATGGDIVVQLAAGTYNITVTGPQGYTVALPSSNVTVSSTNQNFNVTFSKGSGVNPTVLYGGVGAGVFFGGAAGALATMFVTGSGIFRKPEE